MHDYMDNSLCVFYAFLVCNGYFDPYLYMGMHGGEEKRNQLRQIDWLFSNIRLIFLECLFSNIRLIVYIHRNWCLKSGLVSTKTGRYANSLMCEMILHVLSPNLHIAHLNLSPKLHIPHPDLSPNLHIHISFLIYTFHIQICLLIHTFHIHVCLLTYTFHIQICLLIYTFHIHICLLIYTFHIHICTKPRLTAVNSVCIF